jgi:NADPH:quinone reductase-like Zn-dependent oxidoreductase
LGETNPIPIGTAQELVCVDENEVELAPEHLTPAEAVALPLAGLTGGRAFMTKCGNAKKARNILITGMGGGVALNIMQLAVGVGANAYVTSGNEKIEKEKTMGVKGCDLQGESLGGGLDENSAKGQAVFGRNR